MEELVKIVVFVPLDFADKVRQAMGDAGAGRIGKYSHCTFSSIGFGRYKPWKAQILRLVKLENWRKLKKSGSKRFVPKIKQRKLLKQLRKPIHTKKLPWIFPSYKGRRIIVSDIIASI